MAVEQQRERLRQMESGLGDHMLLYLKTRRGSEEMPPEPVLIVSHKNARTALLSHVDMMRLEGIRGSDLRRLLENAMREATSQVYPEDGADKEEYILMDVLNIYVELEKRSDLQKNISEAPSEENHEYYLRTLAKQIQSNARHAMI